MYATCSEKIKDISMQHVQRKFKIYPWNMFRKNLGFRHDELFLLEA